MLSPALASALLVALGAAGVNAQQRQNVWGQCGGIGWTGPTLCVDGTYCFQQNSWYYQCLPGTGPTTATPTTTSTTTSAPQQSTTLSTSRTTSAPPTSTTQTSSGGSTACPAIPNGLGTPVSNALNDPFTFHGGGKVSSKADWSCRQAEMSQLLQKYELGTLPGKPSSVTASFSGSTLSITVSENGKSISFSVTINNRPSGQAGPAIINYGTFGGLPIPSGVATILFNNDEIAQQQDQSSRGKGKFYDLYGSSHSAGALTAWAWGVSRIIDALELTKAQTNIDPTRIGVTGCSRNGKGAMVAGAFEPRIALTLPEESGAGGSGCWRIAAMQKSQGQNVQDATQIITENVWFSTNFNPYVNNVNSLPFDHHMLAGLIAPRPIYVMENVDMEWLGKVSTYGCMGIARKQWEALGALDKFGYSQVGGNSHCSFPSSQQSSELNAFIGKYLLNNANAGNTSIFRSTATQTFNLASWSPWTVPSLS